MSKFFLKSKTLWANGLIMAGFVAVYGPEKFNELGSAIQNTGVDQLATAIAPVGNFLLRFTTNEGVGWAGKSALKSKTVWFNVILLGFAAYRLVEGGRIDFAAILVVLALVNLWLRRKTDSGVHFLPRLRG